MVFRVSSSSKRSALFTCLMALIVAGVGSGSSRSGSSAAATGAGTGAAARSGGDVDGGRRLGLVLAAWRSSSGALLRFRRGNGLCCRRGFFFDHSRLRSHFSSRLLRLRVRSGSRGFVHAVFTSGIFPICGPSSSPVQVDAEAQAGAPKVDHVALEVGEFKAQVAQGDRAPNVDHVILVGVRFHDVAHALLADDLGDDVVPQRPHGVGSVGQAAAAKVDLRVRLHLHEGEDLLVARLVHEAGAQQVVDAQGLAGRGALRVAAAPWKLGAQFLIVQDQPVAVVGHLQLVARLHVGGAGEVAADPGGQAHAGVGSDRELRPVQRAQGSVLPVEVGPAVGAQEGVRHPDLEDTQPRRALQVHRLAYVELEVRISSCHALP